MTKYNLSKDLAKILICFFTFSLFFACSDTTSIDNGGKSEVFKINKSKSFISDSIYIDGNNFTSSNKIYIRLISDSTTFVQINSSDFIKSTKFTLGFIIPDSIANFDKEFSKLQVFFDADSSKIFDLIIRKYVSFDTVLVNKGIFSMGSEAGQADEKPIRDVTISKELIVSKYEVSNRAFNTLMTRKNNNLLNYDFQKQNFPISNVTWFDAITYCNKLSKVYNLTPAYSITFTSDTSVIFDPSSNGWRLPSESEWEYLCKAGTNNDISGTGQIDQMAWYAVNSGMNAHTLGTKAANQFGLYDMHGNVWEWCWDWYSETYYKENINQDPLGPNTGTKHVLRGGSCEDGFSYCRSSNRRFIGKNLEHVGFRIVRNK